MFCFWPRTPTFPAVPRPCAREGGVPGSCAVSRAGSGASTAGCRWVGPRVLTSVPWRRWGLKEASVGRPVKERPPAAHRSSLGCRIQVFLKTQNQTQLSFARLADPIVVGLRSAFRARPGPDGARAPPCGAGPGLSLRQPESRRAFPEARPWTGSSISINPHTGTLAGSYLHRLRRPGEAGWRLGPRQVLCSPGFEAGASVPALRGILRAGCLQLAGAAGSARALGRAPVGPGSPPGTKRLPGLPPAEHPAPVFMHPI
jgi:hypothetical protein